jgi:hypothetical protein
MKTKLKEDVTKLLVSYGAYRVALEIKDTQGMTIWGKNFSKDCDRLGLTEEDFGPLKTARDFLSMVARAEEFAT